MMSLTGTEMSNNCGLCASRLISAIIVHILSTYKLIFTPPQLLPQIPKFCISLKQRLVCFLKYAVPVLIDPLMVQN